MLYYYIINYAADQLADVAKSVFLSNASKKSKIFAWNRERFLDDRVEPGHPPVNHRMILYLKVGHLRLYVDRFYERHKSTAFGGVKKFTCGQDNWERYGKPLDSS